MKSHDKIMMPKSRLEIFVADADFITLVRGTGRERARERERVGNAIKIAQPLKILPEVLAGSLARWLARRVQQLLLNIFLNNSKCWLNNIGHMSHIAPLYSFYDQFLRAAASQSP